VERVRFVMKDGRTVAGVAAPEAKR
jgi:hypothetical protein